jgi:hypothetical protein
MIISAKMPLSSKITGTVTRLENTISRDTILQTIELRDSSLDYVTEFVRIVNEINL